MILPYCTLFFFLSVLCKYLWLKFVVKYEFKLVNEKPRGKNIRFHCGKILQVVFKFPAIGNAFFKKAKSDQMFTSKIFLNRWSAISIFIFYLGPFAVFLKRKKFQGNWTLLAKFSQNGIWSFFPWLLKYIMFNKN